MEILETLIGWCWAFLQIAIGYNLAMPFLLFILFLFVPKRKRTEGLGDEADYAIIVTAYEQVHTLPPVIDSLLKMDYSNYVIYIVADKCDVSGLAFEDPRVVVLRPPETLGSNTRSHFYAIERFVRDHDRLTIIDSDNLVEPDYLLQLDKMFDQGFMAVQGERKAKNLDTTFSCLDAARDIYYHYYDGKVLFGLGSSATLAGSGMAFTVALYRECLEQLDITGAGFDKVLQKEIVSRGHRIAFNGDAIVYDEKTSKPDQLVKQRARWINTWFRYFGFGFQILGTGIRRFDCNQILFGLVLLRPPLFIFLILSAMMMAINVLIDINTALLWATGFLMFITGFMLALLVSPTDKRIFQALKGIPNFVFLQVRSLLKARRANQISVATQHFHDNKIEEIK